MSTIVSVLLHASVLAAGSTGTCDLTGSWDLRASDETIFRLKIGTARTGPTAVWERPRHFETDGESFSRLRGPVIHRQARSVRTVNGDLELSFDNPAPGASPDIFGLHCVAADHIDVTYQGAGFEPLRFVRAQVGISSLGPWDTGRTYVRVIHRPTNLEMTGIFDADQADRQAADIDWSVVGPADDKRRARTEELLRSGALQSGDDFYHAAFLFQHGSVPDDYLMAHLLAVIAVARGKPEAVWIASATLDRYLQTSGKPQVLGTQFKLPEGAPATQEPYNRALVSDAMRKALRVPTLPEQEEQRQRYDKRASTPKKP